MDSKRLRECLDVDFRRLRDVVAGADLTNTVPSCPDWTVRDLADHVGMVYLHKVECMRLGHHPQPWPPDDLKSGEPVELLDRAYAALTAEFAAREPESHAFTWYEPEQTVGFWIRRMAQETAIHRVDAELGAGVPIAPIPADLAADGIDEFLFTFIEWAARAWPEDFEKQLGVADGRAAKIATPSAAWLIRPTRTAVEVHASDVDSETEVAAVISGDAAQVLLWIWNRADDNAVTVTGDESFVTYLREVMATGAQ